MKIICNGMDLADALTKVSKALPIKKTIPILDGIKLSAFGSTLTISATDIDFAISKDIKTDIMMEGEALLNGKLLSDYAKKVMYVGQVTISDINENTIALFSDDSRFSIKIMNLEEYPAIQNIEYDVSFNILQKDFKELINQTIFSAASDDIRPILKGCLLEIVENKIKCVALDGYRLAVATKELYQKEINYSVVVPAKSLSEIAKLLEEDEKTVNIKINKNKLFVDLNHTKVSTALLSGAFVSYESSIPNSFETQIVINKKMFEDAIERASIMSKFEKTNLIKVEIKDEKVFITSNSEMGDAKEVISVKITGKDMTIGFNAKYLSECLKAINDEFIQMFIKAPNSPCVIKPLEKDNFLYLIVPIRTK